MGTARRWRASALLCAIAVAAILAQVWTLPAPGDIAQALTQNPDAYTLSLGHMGDLTLASFAYLRLPLAVAGIAFLAGGLGCLFLRGRQAVLAIAVMMTLFFARGPAGSCRLRSVPRLAPAGAGRCLEAPPGTLIADNQYYTFSSVFFYTNRTALLLNGRVNNLEYGSYAPGAPRVFIDDEEFRARWQTAERYYLLAEKPAVARVEKLVGAGALLVVKASGGKYLFTNRR